MKVDERVNRTLGMCSMMKISSVEKVYKLIFFIVQTCGFHWEIETAAS